MDYDILVNEFMQKMQLLNSCAPLKQLNESMHGEAFVLMHLRENQLKNEIIPSDISLATGLSSARIAATLNSLENKGFITRQIDTEDRRKIIVKLTQDGNNFALNQKNKHINMLKILLKNLGENDATQFIRIVSRIAEIMLDDKLYPCFLA